jgi:type I restriction enzyme, S subunit
MIADLKPYPEYKEWDLPWLDSVPKHWDMAPNRALMKEQRDKVGENARDYTLLSLTLRGVIARDMVNPKGKFPARFNTYKIVRPNDFVFCLFDIDETPRGVGLSPHNGMITGAYDIFSPTHRINPRFLYYYYLFIDDGKLMKPYYTGLRKTIQRGVFASLKAPVPPPAEQSAIVRFLDHWNGRLEKAIRSKRRVVALLQEQKQAIIHRAVTRGLDPNVKLKDSGIPWLGEIPEYWEVAKFKHFFRVQMGQTFLKPDLSDTGELPVLSATMSGAILGYTTKAKARTILKVGDLVIPARGNSIGYVALVSQICTSSQTTIQALRIQNDRLLTRFAHLFSVGNKPFLYSFVQTAIPQITTREVATNPLIVPPISEQQEICDSIDRECSGLNTAIARFEREITLLREYRTRLTADVVTGKLDVRAAAAQLPEEAEDEPLPEPELPEEETEMEEVEG